MTNPTTCRIAATIAKDACKRCMTIFGGPACKQVMSYCTKGYRAQAEAIHREHVAPLEAENARLRKTLEAINDHAVAALTIPSGRRGRMAVIARIAGAECARWVEGSPLTTEAQAMPKQFETWPAESTEGE